MAEFPVLLWCQRKRADVARLLENFLETGLAVDLFMIARQRQQHRRGILRRRACQLDCNLAAGEHHVNDLLGGFAVSYVDGKSPPICSRVFATLLSLVGIFPVLQCPAASLLPNPQSRGTA